METREQSASIEWIDHASFMLSSGDVRLACDPWTTGSAFDNGWDLMTQDAVAPDLSSCTHIWISHEHPDHFSPPTLRQIPRDARAGITILFQQTTDRRVADWCLREGFAVLELGPHGWRRLGDDCQILCRPHDNGDSWLAVRIPGSTLVNLNDCVVTTRRECEQILAAVGTVDVLATQFSFANWIANTDEDSVASKAVDEKLRWLHTQVAALKPSYVIPFASFVYFSHEDNFFLNKWMISPERAIDVIERNNVGTRAVVLYPGDRWVLGATGYSSSGALERYAQDRRRIAEQGPRHHAEIVPLDELVAHGAAYFVTLRRRNRAWIRLLPDAHAFVRDHGVALRLSTSGVRIVDMPEEDCDIACNSDALDHVFLVPWGGRTLDINGRFQVPKGGHYRKFKAYSTVSSFNSRGEDGRAIAATILRRIIKRLRR